MLRLRDTSKKKPIYKNKLSLFKYIEVENRHVYAISISPGCYFVTSDSRGNRVRLNIDEILFQAEGYLLFRFGDREFELIYDGHQNWFKYMEK